MLLLLLFKRTIIIKLNTAICLNVINKSYYSLKKRKKEMNNKSPNLKDRSPRIYVRSYGSDLPNSTTKA